MDNQKPTEIAGTMHLLRHASRVATKAFLSCSLSKGLGKPKQIGTKRAVKEIRYEGIHIVESRYPTSSIAKEVGGVSSSFTPQLYISF
jgi:hypothetical protein